MNTDIPRVGSQVTVVRRNNQIGVVGWRAEFTEYTGQVVPRFPWLSTDEFCVRGEEIRPPVRIFHIRDIHEIHENGVVNPVAPQSATVNSQSGPWKVLGSRGDSYVVRCEGVKWSCTCPAGNFRRKECRHIAEIRSRHT